MARPRGIVTVNVLPSPSTLSTRTVPPCSFDQLVDERQADAGALVRAAAAVLHPVEALEHPRQLFRRNADAGVADA